MCFSSNTSLNGIKYNNLKGGIAMNELKFAPISKKMLNVEVTGQACKPEGNCLTDCERKVWEGNSSSSISGCKKVTLTDSHWSQCR